MPFFSKEKSIDVLVNNAGCGSYEAIEDVPLGEARRQFEVNLFGMARLIQLVVPAMRENHYGKIINISSMGGKIWTKFGGWYHATKYAVEGLSDCLRMELKPFGIDVVVVEPGGIKADWGIIAAENLRKTSASGAYTETANKAADGMVKNYSGNMLSKPELIAKTVRKAVAKRRPRSRYLIGFGAKPMVWTHKIFGTGCMIGSSRTSADGGDRGRHQLPEAIEPRARACGVQATVCHAEPAQERFEHHEAECRQIGALRPADEIVLVALQSDRGACI